MYASTATLPQAQALQVVQMQPARLSHHGQRMGVARVPMGRAMSTSALHAQVELLGLSRLFSCQVMPRYAMVGARESR